MGLVEDYNLVVVTIGGENKWWGNSDITGDHFGDMILDVVNFTRRLLRLSDKREDTFIGGFSMGGYGAFVNGLRHPELFSKIISVNAALNKTSILESVNEPTWDLFLKRHYEAMFGYKDISEYEGSDNDYEALAEKVKAMGAEMMPDIFMACGNEDVLCAGNIAYRDFLKNLGYNVEWYDYPANHSWYSFDIGMEAAIKWLPLETFRDSFMYYGRDAYIDPRNFAHWNAWYNLEAQDKK